MSDIFWGRGPRVGAGGRGSGPRAAGRGRGPRVGAAGRGRGLTSSRPASQSSIGIVNRLKIDTGNVSEGHTSTVLHRQIMAIVLDGSQGLIRDFDKPSYFCVVRVFCNKYDKKINIYHKVKKY